MRVKKERSMQHLRKSEGEENVFVKAWRVTVRPVEKCVFWNDLATGFTVFDTCVLE